MHTNCLWQTLGLFSEVTANTSILSLPSHLLNSLHQFYVQNKDGNYVYIVYINTIIILLLKNFLASVQYL